MALVVADRVRETTTTEGTGTITLGGAVANFETFTANLSDSDTTYYAIVDSSNNAFEVGLGTFTASGTTLARTTIIASSNSNNAVNFGAGTKDVFITIPASKMIVKDTNGNVSIDGDVTVADGSNDFDVASHDGTNGLKLGGNIVTSSAAELNILTGKSFVDEDNMASNSATAIPSQQSVKAYVDTQLTAEDLDITTDSGTIDIDLDSETLTIAGGTGLSSSASSTTVTMAVDAAQTGITSVVNTSLEIGRDADNRIKFGTDNQIIFEVDGGDNVIFKASGEIEATSLDISGDVDVDGTLEADAITVDGTALATVIAGTTVNNATLASTVTVSDSTANTNFPVVFHDESNALLDDTGALRYNPSTGELLVPKLTVAGTTTTVDTVTMNAQNAVVFEGATADSNETTLTITDPTADRTITLPDATGQVVLSSGAIDSDASAEIGRAHIGNIGFSDMAGFSHVDRNTAASYAILQNASGTTFLNAADGQVINFNINNSNVMNVESTGLSLFAGKNIVFEGSTSDDFETFINVIDPTADRSINFPDASGTISLITATETLTNKTLTTPVIAEIDNSGDITLDAGGDIVLDAGGEQVIFKDGSTNVGHIDLDSDNLTIKSLVQDKDIVFKGNDGGSEITALTLDMSSSGNANFTGGVKSNQYFWMTTDGNTALFAGVNFEIRLNHIHNTGFRLNNNGTGTPAVELQFVDENESIGSDGTNLILTSGGNAITVPNTGADTATLNAATQTLTNKTLTSPKINENVVLTATATELNIIDGDTSATSTTVADADRVVLNDNGTMVQVAVTDLAAYFDDEITAMPNLVTTAATTVGALDSGSITSGFGSINTGSSTITTTGLITGGSLDIDDVLINGSNIGHTDDTDLITVANGLVTVAGEISVTTLDIGGTNVTATAAELNIMDGVTATTAELNKLDGVSSTTAELNLLDGLTATTAELNLMDGGTSAGTTAVAGGDGIVTNDNGTMRQTTVDTFDTYLSATTKTLTNKTLTTPVINGFSGTGDGSIIGDLTVKTSDGALLKLQTSDTTVVDGDSIGEIRFSSPDEASGTDAVQMHAAIVAEADATFSASNNETDLVFKLGTSGAALEKMRLHHNGDMTLTSYNESGSNVGPSLILDKNSASPADNDFLGALVYQFRNSANETQNAAMIRVRASDITDGTEDTFIQIRTFKDGSATNSVIIENDTTTFNGGIVIANAGTIGSASDTDAISIASDGKTTFSQNIIASGNIELGNASDTTLARSSAGVVTIEGNTIATREQLKGDATNGAGVFSNELIARKLHTGTILTAQDDTSQIIIAGRPMGAFFSQTDLTADRIHFMPVMIPGTGASGNFTVGGFRFRTGFSGTVTDRTVKMGLYTLNTQGYPSQLVSKSSASSGTSLNASIVATPDVTSITPGRYALALVSVTGSTRIVVNFNSGSAGATFYQDGFTDFADTGKPTGLALDGAMSSGNLPTDLSSTSGYIDQQTMPWMSITYGATYSGE